MHIGEFMTHVHEISRIELFLKGRNAKIIFLFFVSLYKLLNEINLGIYNGIFFSQYTFGMAYMK